MAKRKATKKVAKKATTKKKASKKKAPRRTTAKSAKKAFQQKFIFVTGGVVSSVGKGLAAASIGTLLESRGFTVSLMKCDPYINVDPGTMSPLQHGEVYVTEDGGETDLDLGHYERFTSISLGKTNSITAGQVYDSVITRERRGDYLGGTVQVIPHITDEIKARIFESGQGAEVVIVEIGGTVGDIEGLPFIEAIRQMRADVGIENSVFVHVTYVPYIPAAGELKSKPTQHSVKELREVGIQPDFLICRSDRHLNQEIKNKIGLFCSVHSENVVAATDAPSIYEVPLTLHRDGLDEKLISRLMLEQTPSELSDWKDMVDCVLKPETEVTVGIVGKYVDLKESYKSLHEAMVHGGIPYKAKVNLVYIDSEILNEKNSAAALQNVDAIMVPGGFGERGIDGKLHAIKYARENSVPFFGICLGMQLATIDFAKNVCGIKDATSREFSSKRSKNLVIDYMEEQKGIKDLGGTMRLGAYACHLEPNTKAQRIYGEKVISERHRHRFEFNNKFKDLLQKRGLVLSGICKERNLVEIVELPDHPWFIGVQFHPEFKSKPLEPHPLFQSFIEAGLNYRRLFKEKTPVVEKRTKSRAQRAQA